MLFKIIRVSDGAEMFQTTTEKCIPPKDVLKDMLKYGMKAYLDGKVYKVEK